MGRLLERAVFRRIHVTLWVALALSVVYLGEAAAYWHGYLAAP